MEVNFQIQGVKEPWFNTLILEDTCGNEIVIDRDHTTYSSHEEEDGSVILDMTWTGCYFWDSEKGEQKYGVDLEDEYFECLRGAVLKELEVEDDAPEGYAPEVLDVRIWGGPVYAIVQMLKNEYEVNSETRDASGVCTNIDAITAFNTLDEATEFAQKYQRQYPELTLAIRHYQFFVDGRGNESDRHLIMVYDVEPEETTDKVFSIEYRETYARTYKIKARSYEEARKILEDGLFEGTFEGPDCCVGSSYEEVA